MSQDTSTLYNRLATLILYGILIFCPLARGSAHLWTHTVFQITVLAALTLLILEKLNTTGLEFTGTPLGKPFIALTLWFLISSIFAQYRPDAIEASMLLLPYIALYYIVIHTVRTRKQQRQLVYVILCIALFLSIFGFFQRFGLNPFWWWRYEGLNLNSNSLSSTYKNYNHLAGYLEMSLPLLLGLFLTRTRRGALFFLMIYCVILIVAAHVLSLSRGGWFALTVALLFMATTLLIQQRFRRKKMLLTITAGLFLLILFILTGTHIVERILTITEEEIIVGFNGRTIAWNGTVEMINDYWLTGSGPGSYATIFTQYQPPGIASRFFYAHNDYLHYTAELGLPIILIMCWFIYVLFKTGFKKLQSPSRQTWGITLGAMTGIIAMLLHSFGDFNLHLPANATLFTLLAAIVMNKVNIK